MTTSRIMKNIYIKEVSLSPWTEVRRRKWRRTTRSWRIRTRASPRVAPDAFSAVDPSTLALERRETKKDELNVCQVILFYYQSPFSHHYNVILFPLALIFVSRSFMLTQVITEIWMLLQFGVFEAVAAEKNVRAPRRHREAAEGHH
jgi:hypothetical protein